MPFARIKVSNPATPPSLHLLGQVCLVLYQGDLLQGDDGNAQSVTEYQPGATRGHAAVSEARCSNLPGSGGGGCAAVLG